jgi:hypothetical protein
MSKADKVGNVLEKLYRGCGWLLINFFVLIFLCWGLYKVFVGFRAETNGETTEGHVSRLEPRDGGTFQAVIEFEANGQTYSFNDDTSSYPPRFDLGETVMVRYDRSNPNIAQIDSRFPLWLVPSCLMAGLLVTLIGVNIVGVIAWRRGEAMIDFV